MVEPEVPARRASMTARIPAPVRGALWMVTACAFLSVVTALVRKAAAGAHPFEIAFLRNVFVLLFMLPLMVRSDRARLKTRHPALQVLRNLFGLANMLCWFTAFSIMPVADAMALSFTSPLFATIGAAVVLGETVGLRRWLAVAVGFVGALVIIRPAGQGLDLPAVLMLVGSVLGAAAILTTKFLSRTHHPDTIVFYMGLMMTPMALPPALMVWTTPSLETILWAAAVGAAATVGNLCHVRAFASTDASAVLPFDFSKLVFAALYGVAFFGEVPDVWTWVGAAIIFGATLYTTRAEAEAGVRPI